MGTPARKTGSKPSKRGSAASSRRTHKAPAENAEVISLVDARVRKLARNPKFQTQLVDSMLEAVVEQVMEQVVAKLRSLAETAGGLDAATPRRASPEQMAARRRSYELALEHNDPPSDEVVAAIKREWG
jgi:hypothetical protein